MTTVLRPFGQEGRTQLSTSCDQWTLFAFPLIPPDWQEPVTAGGIEGTKARGATFHMPLGSFRFPGKLVFSTSLFLIGCGEISHTSDRGAIFCE
ncbi:hypothetical protein FKM82_022446 [Ascaphus truei]